MGKSEMITSTYKRKKSGMVAQACDLLKGKSDELRPAWVIASLRLWTTK